MELKHIAAVDTKSSLISSAQLWF